MKKLAVFLCAAGAVVAGVAFTPAFSVPASAVDVYLTPEQTRALFGDTLPASIYTFSGDYKDVNFEYLTYGTYGSLVYNTPSPLYNPNGTQCVIYHYYDGANSNTPDYSTESVNYTVKITPTIDIYNLTSLQMTMGFSTRAGYSANRVQDYNSFSWYKSDSQNNSTIQIVRPIGKLNDSRKWYFNLASVSVKNPLNGDILTTAYSSLFQINLLSQNESFGFAMNGSIGDAGLSQLGQINSHVLTSPSNDDLGTLLIISCPYLSDDYINSSPSESSGGGSDSGGGYDGPDYSGQLALILAKLDLIINNDFNIDVDLTADLAGLESRLDGVNSRLDVNNSRLDGNNSRLDGVNSRLDGVNSRLDNISGELHDLNSAPTETIPNSGGENSEFDRQAQMYMSDFQNEYEDSENQVFEVIDKGTGFLGFVREFLITSHLAQILPLLALLFIAHYVIFERGG